MNLGRATMSLAGFHLRSAISTRQLKERGLPLWSELGRRAQLARHESWRLQLLLVHLGFIEKLSSAAKPNPKTIQAIQKRYYALLRKDWDNAQRGVYPASLLKPNPILRYARNWPALIADLAKLKQRAKRGGFLELPEGARAQYPAYYARCFHWQSDGYLSEHSARIYDLEVELLFLGCADVMRRQALVPISKAERRSPLSLLDIGCGTGAFLRQAAATLPRASLHGVDLSPYYVEQAKRVVPKANLIAGNAEQLPYQDNSFDIVTSVFLFHELPKDVRRRVLSEALRVLKPGGRLIIEDAAQLSESPELREVLERFEKSLHEPFFKGYLKDSLEDVLREFGAKQVQVERCFVSKVVSATF